MATKYELKGNEIHREGVIIATRDPGTGTVDYLPDMDRYRAPVAGWLAENGLSKPPVTPPEVAAKQAKPHFIGSPAAAPEGANTTPPQDEPAGEPTADQKRIAELEAQLAALKGGKQASPSAPSKPLATPRDHKVFVAKQDVTGFIKPSKGDDFMDPMKLRTYPDAPKYGVEGDKTPAFVEWLFANHPKDAEARYFNRKIPGTPYEERIQALRDAGKL